MVFSIISLVINFPIKVELLLLQRNTEMVMGTQFWVLQYTKAALSKLGGCLAKIYIQPQYMKGVSQGSTPCQALWWENEGRAMIPPCRSRLNTQKS